MIDVGASLHHCLHVTKSNKEDDKIFNIDRLDNYKVDNLEGYPTKRLRSRARLNFTTV